MNTNSGAKVISILEVKKHFNVVSNDGAVLYGVGCGFKTDIEDDILNLGIGFTSNGSVYCIRYAGDDYPQDVNGLLEFLDLNIKADNEDTDAVLRYGETQVIATVDNGKLEFLETAYSMFDMDGEEGIRLRALLEEKAKYIYLLIDEEIEMDMQQVANISKRNEKFNK